MFSMMYMFLHHELQVFHNLLMGNTDIVGELLLIHRIYMYMLQFRQELLAEDMSFQPERDN